MQFKIIAIPATGDHEAEEDLNRFLRAHREVGLQEELVRDGCGAFWCFCIEYLLGAAGTQGSDRGRSRVDYKQVLSESDFAVFAKLRDVRTQAATWNNHARNCRSANRNNSPDNRNNNLGFRLATARRIAEHVRRTGQSPAPVRHHSPSGANPPIADGIGSRSGKGSSAYSALRTARAC